MENFYVRQPNDEEAKGPYNKDQLETLMIAGQITEETLYHDQDTDEWLLLKDHPELGTRLFPQKIRVKIKKRQEAAAEQGVADDSPAAPTDDYSRILQDEKKARIQAENKNIQDILFGTIPYWPQLAGVIALLASASLLYPHFAEIKDVFGKFSLLWEQPAIGFGLLDLLVALFLLLGAASFSNYLRARGIIMAGVALLYWWTGVEFSHSLTSILAAVGILLFSCTRWAIIQGVGFALAAVSLLIIVLEGGYVF